MKPALASSVRTATSLPTWQPRSLSQRWRRALSQRWRRALTLLVIGLLLAGCSRHLPERDGSGLVLAGTVTAIADGDSFTLTTPDGRRVGVRISGIDAPEKGQAWADASRDHLVKLLSYGPLAVEPIKTDPYGRQVARVRIRGEDIGLQQVQAGLAWYFVRYAADQRPDERERYARAEREARSAHRGLWTDPQPLAPWLYRQQRRP